MSDRTTRTIVAALFSITATLAIGLGWTAVGLVLAVIAVGIYLRIPRTPA